MQYVALPYARLAKRGSSERALIPSGLSYLRAGWRNEHWTLHAVTAATLTVDKPAELVSMDAPQHGCTNGIGWFRWTTLDAASGGCIQRSGDQLPLHTGAGHGMGRYLVSSSVNLRNRAAQRGHYTS